MELDVEKINKSLLNMTNSVDKIYLYRLVKKLESSKDTEEDFNMILIHREYIKISNKFKSVINNGLIDNEFKKIIERHYELLGYLVKSIDLEDQVKCANLKNELIYLECMLDLPIYYYKTAKEILDNIIDKELSLKRDKNE